MYTHDSHTIILVYRPAIFVTLYKPYYNIIYYITYIMYIMQVYNVHIYTIRMFYYYGWLTSSRQRNIARISGVRRCSLQVYYNNKDVRACNQIPITHIYTCIIYADVYIIISFPYLLYIFFKTSSSMYDALVYALL